MESLRRKLNTFTSVTGLGQSRTDSEECLSNSISVGAVPPPMSAASHPLDVKRMPATDGAPMQDLFLPLSSTPTPIDFQPNASIGGMSLAELPAEREESESGYSTQTSDKTTTRQGKEEQVVLFTGPMYAGKTTALLTIVEQARAAGEKVLVIKKLGDDRYA